MPWRAPVTRAAALAAALLVVAAAPSVARAALLEPLPRAGEAGVALEARANRFDDRPAAGTDARWRAWTRVGLGGDLGPGGLLSWQGAVRPGWLRGDPPDGGGAVRAAQLDWDVSGRLLAGRPVSGTFAHARARGTSERAARPLGEFEVETSSAEAALAWRPLPLRLTWLERSTYQRWTVDPRETPLVTDYAERTVRLAARNDRTDLVLQRAHFDDRDGREDFRSTHAAFGHTLRWGRGSRLATALAQTRRERASAYRQASWEERLRLQHLRSLATEWSVARFETDALGARSRTDGWSGAVEHRPAAWLAWGGRAATHHARLDGAANTVRVLAPRASVRLAPGRGVVLSAGVDAAFERREERGGRGASRAVVGERHVVPPTRVFVLDQPGADPASVVVRAAGGAITYVAPLDYRVTRVGDVVQVDVPATSRIAPGDALEADYRHVPAGLERSTARATSANAAISWGGLSLRHRRAARGADAESPGLRATVPAYDERATEAEARLRGGACAATLRAERRERESDGPRYRADRLQADLAPPVAGGLASALCVTVERRRGAGARLDIASAALRLGWSAPGALRLDGTVDAYRSRIPGAPAERAVSASLDAGWTFGAVEAGGRFAQQWRSGTIPGTARHVALRVVRRF